MDGIAKLLLDINFFIFMYIKKESAYSSQIEGTKARLTDALLAEVEKTAGLPDDVDDILHYINAVHEGLRQLESLPLSLRLIKEIHRVLLTKARSSTYPYPGEFKRSQNWVMGTSPADARFVPPPPEYMVSAMGDLEEFFYSNQDIPALIKIALIHSQFETIHPFIDGNGRVGRFKNSPAFHVKQQIDWQKDSLNSVFCILEKKRKNTLGYLSIKNIWTCLKNEE